MAETILHSETQAGQQKDRGHRDTLRITFPCRIPLPPFSLPCPVHHLPVGPGGGTGAAAADRGGAGSMEDDARVAREAASFFLGPGSPFLPPGLGAGRVGLQDTAGCRVVGGDPPWATLWPGMGAGMLAPPAAGSPFAGVALPKEGCRAGGDEPPAGPGPGMLGRGLPAAGPAGGRTERDPGLPPARG